MKKGFIIISCVIILTGSVLAGCQTSEMHPANNTNEPALIVLAAESFITDMAQNVAGDRIKVETLMPLGMDPHGFEPTPQDVARIADSNVLIINGAGFEEWLQDVINNAGGSRTIIEASAGLVSRLPREGEVAELSAAELGDSMCVSFQEQEPQPGVTGKDKDSAVELPIESGLFNLALSDQDDGTFSGYIQYLTDESGDFQIITSDGKVEVSRSSDGKVMEIEKNLALSCKDARLGRIIELAKDEKYLISLTGFTSENITMLIGPAGGHHHHDGDPHFWLDPINAIKYVENIRDGLIEADPEGKVIYTNNAESYIKQLIELDQTIRQKVSVIPVNKRLIVTNHESFGYYADRYEFRIIGTIIPSVSTGASPSAQQLAQLIDHIKETGAIAIFLETGTNPQLAKQISNETGVKVVADLYTHSITAANGSAPTYIDMVLWNTDQIVLSLK